MGAEGELQRGDVTGLRVPRMNPGNLVPDPELLPAMRGSILRTQPRQVARSPKDMEQEVRELGMSDTSQTAVNMPQLCGL